MTTAHVLTLAAAVLEAGQCAHGTAYPTHKDAVQDASNLLIAAEELLAERHNAALNRIGDGRPK